MLGLGERFSQEKKGNYQNASTVLGKPSSAECGSKSCFLNWSRCNKWFTFIGAQIHCETTIYKQDLIMLLTGRHHMLSMSSPLAQGLRLMIFASPAPEHFALTPDCVMPTDACWLATTRTQAERANQGAPYASWEGVVR